MDLSLIGLTSSGPVQKHHLDFIIPDANVLCRTFCQGNGLNIGLLFWACSFVNSSVKGNRLDS